ncbi:UNVERIFIED_CONTAM: FAD synthase [Sesamum radiatum]|uniref:FAD synthase n=1 Tax=Sesamum radiatum TaxID=300843 RepID=A0AAW2KUL9_SESRA
MEIDEAIKGSGDKRLKSKYNIAIYVIQRALALYSVEEVALSFNGGKDSTVLLHLLRAGYYLHAAGKNLSIENPGDADITFPIRTIYFENPTAFPEINSFTYETAFTYKLQMDIIRLDFKSGLEALLKANPIRAIFLGVRSGDPTGVGQEQFSPSSPGWPPFMRVNPILGWSYRPHLSLLNGRDVWAFLLTCKVQYCTLYDQGYTSIGSIHDTVPNGLLYLGKSSDGEAKFKPAYLLPDGRSERAGRAKKFISQPLTAISNGLKNEDLHLKSMFTASVIAVGDEILSGTIEDRMRSILCRKIHSIGWAVSHVAVIRNDIDSVADEVERQKSTNDKVFIYGGFGPLPSDITVAGVAKHLVAAWYITFIAQSFNLCWFDLRKLIVLVYLMFGRVEECREFEVEFWTFPYVNGEKVPEGITKLLHHEKLSLPLIKCQNVIILTATNVGELEQEWDCLIEWMRSNELSVKTEAFVSKRVATSLSDDKERIRAAAEALCKKFHPGTLSEID